MGCGGSSNYTFGAQQAAFSDVEWIAAPNRALGGGGGGSVMAPPPSERRLVRSRTVRTGGSSRRGTGMLERSRSLRGIAAISVSASKSSVGGGGGGGGPAGLQTFSPTEFEVGKLLGTGAQGRVSLARHRRQNKFYALKTMNRAWIAEKQSMHVIVREAQVHMLLKTPFVAQLFGIMQDKQNIYMVEEYVPGGELYSRMNSRRMPEHEAKFYFVELAWALKTVHEKALVAYRDLKPENVLIDARGHIKMIDFGLSKKVSESAFGHRRKAELSFGERAGTCEYKAPELVSGEGTHGQPVDWWALGALLFEMFTGATPFSGGIDSLATKDEVYKMISTGKVVYPNIMPTPVRQLCVGLLTVDSAKRWGFDQIRRCAWLRDVDWIKVHERTYKAPFVPKLKKTGDTSNYTPKDRKQESSKPLDSKTMQYTDILRQLR